MDLRLHEDQLEATTSHTSLPESSSPPAQPFTPTNTKHPIRSSARVRAAKQKELDQEKAKQFDPSTPDQASAAASSSSGTGAPSRTTTITKSPTKSKRSRETEVNKGKALESPHETSARSTKRTHTSSTSVSPSLSASDSPRDSKGKKRAAPENLSDDETLAHTTSSASSKRLRTVASSYSLRSRDQLPTSPLSNMGRKTKSSPTKSKSSPKGKSIASSSSSRMDDDIDMLDTNYDRIPASESHADDNGEYSRQSREDHPAKEGAGNEDEDENKSSNPTTNTETGQGLSGLAGLNPSNMDEADAMAAILGEFRQFGSYMLGMSSRLKSLLNSIKSTADPTTRLLALQELSELLSMSTEDTLGGFPVEQYVRELVKILGGTGHGDGDDDDEGNGDGDGDEEMHGEDADLAAALAMSTGGGAYAGDPNPEAQVLACRCLANLMEALPGVAHTIVYHGALPVLCSKLIEISYIDLAEQTLSTLEKVSEEFPSAIVREGGLAALLNYLDFFSIAVQRTALQAAANCCRNISADHFPMLQGVWPIIRNCLTYSDQRLVEFACLCVIRAVDSYQRSHPQHLEALIDTDLIKAVNTLLLPAGGSPLITANTFTLLLRALATSSRASPKITVALLEADIADTLHQILTGVLPSASDIHAEEGNAEDGQGLGGGLADMTVMENLAHRPKDQVEDALSLVSELLPSLPKDGVFDHKSYTEKSLVKLVKSKAKAERAAARAVDPTPSEPITPQAVPEATYAPSFEAEDMILADILPVGAPVLETDDPTVVSTSTTTEATSSKVSSPSRTDTLRSKSTVVGRFMRLMIPVLVDVYAASVISSVRIKSLTSILKAVAFLEAEGLKQTLQNVPIASFVSSILSSRDHPTLVIGALQLVEMLLVKLPDEYLSAFQREGVFHELEALGSRGIISGKGKEKDQEKDREGSATPLTEPALSRPPPTAATIAASIPGYKKLSSLSLDPEDAITYRARIIRFKYFSDDQAASGDGPLAALRQFADALSLPNIREDEAGVILQALARLFCSTESAVSSFELLQSGVVDALTKFATDKAYQVELGVRQQSLYKAFNESTSGSVGATALTLLVKKLQESLTRMESYEVITVSQDSKRSSPSLLARQLRLRLIAEEGSDVPKSLNNIVVSIHAIATFQALHDYLRPRVSGVLSGTSRLSSMLAALAAASAGSSSMASPNFTRDSESLPSASPSKPENTANSTSDPDVTRRQSQRLKAKKAEPPESSDPTPVAASKLSGDDVDTTEDAGPSKAPASTASAAPTLDVATSETVNGDDNHTAIEADFTDDEVDAEVFDEELDGDGDVSMLEDKTITVNVADDGSKVEAQTPDGTRVATPNPAKTIPSIHKGATAGRPSYAAALKTKPSDWHLEFSVDDHILPLDLTIYGAIHQHEMRKNGGSSLSSSLIWQGIHDVKFKKVPGPAPSSDSRPDDTSARSRASSPSLASLPEDASYTKILRLLRVLHKMNLTEHERSPQSALAETAFVNNKLTAKLTRQLEEPMIVASSCLPDWALDLPQKFPFLFPFATRYNFLQSTSFGYARLILKWQSQQNRGQDSSRRDDNIAFLGRLQRQKVRISRKHILESAVKVFEIYGSSSSVLEVEYFEEVGTGLGPTLEFYSLASREFARKNLKLWRNEDETLTSPYVHHPRGLYPAPLGGQESGAESKQKQLHLFRVVGQFIAKAMLDSRIVDMSFNKVFLKMILGEEVPLSTETLRLVDPELASSLSRLQQLALPLEKGEGDKINVEDLALDFTIPGYDIELKPGGRDISVTELNVNEYIHEVLDAILGKGVVEQTQAFRDGFSKVFSARDLQAFTADELAMLFGNTDEDWTIETLKEAIKADHGFNVESHAIHDLIEIMSEYDVPTRRAFLQFITGSPKLPIGGFRGLNPPLTVVRKPHEAPLTADDYLPSVMTCVNYLKLPEYSKKEVMRRKLKTAMKEGVGSFHLS